MMKHELGPTAAGGNPVTGPNAAGLAIEARGLVKRFDGFTAVDGVDLEVPAGAIFGVLGPNGAGKTTTLRMLLGIIDPDEGLRRTLGHERPHEIAHRIGYLPEERGLYPAMKAFEAIAFLGALRGLPLGEARSRARALLDEHGLGYAAERQIRQLSKGLNQGKLEETIRRLAAAGTTVLFSTHVIAHAERLCERIAIIARGKVPFTGPVSEARDRLPQQVRLELARADGRWRAALPPDAGREGAFWHFSLPPGGVEPLLRALIEREAGILSLSIERPGLHDAFVAIAGEAAAKALAEEKER
ncbi:MAG: ATP-binding cassette domain-containing protein [Novosphingobium sp.]|nr:ATP-binding cassette domain-containing protein [Novosphingobium sp.]